jgi:cell division protein FtsB
MESAFHTREVLVSNLRSHSHLIHIHAVTLTTFCALLLQITPCVAQVPTTETTSELVRLQERVQQLETTVARLSQEILELRSLRRDVADLKAHTTALQNNVGTGGQRTLTSEPPPRLAFKEDWNRIKIGMEHGQVLSILGSPDKKFNFGSVNQWLYPANGNVSFDEQGRVKTVTLPYLFEK